MVTACWEAPFAMVDAEFLGYRYPETLVFRVTGHARRMRQGLISGEPLLAEGQV